MVRGARHRRAFASVGGPLLATAALSAGVAFAFVVPALANHTPAHTAAVKGLNATSNAAGLGDVASAPSLPAVIGQIIKAALTISGVVFLVLIVYAGFRWMTAQGNTDEIEKAKKTIQAAVIGIVLAAAAFAITNFVIGALAGVK